MNHLDYDNGGDDRDVRGSIQIAWLSLAIAFVDVMAQLLFWRFKDVARSKGFWAAPMGWLPIMGIAAALLALLLHSLAKDCGFWRIVRLVILLVVGLTAASLFATYPG